MRSGVGGLLSSHLILIYRLFILEGFESLSNLMITGPTVIERLDKPWYQLTCSFSHTQQELAELDIKWYFGPGDSPFLQWVPGSGSPPQTVDIHRGSQNQFKNRLKVKYNLSNVTSEKGLLSQNSTQVHKLDLSVRIARPSVHLSGTYTCKVATFFDEQKSTHSVIIYDPGVGPKLNYVTETPKTLIQCRVHQVYPEPKLQLSIHTEPDQHESFFGVRNQEEQHQSDVTTTTVRRGLMYDVTVNTSIMTSLLSLQTVFSCTMQIPGTPYSLNEKTMFLNSDIRTMTSASHVLNSVTKTLPKFVILVYSSLACHLVVKWGNYGPAWII